MQLLNDDIPQRTKANGYTVALDKVHLRAHMASITIDSWAEAHIKIARMTLTVKLDRNWSSFQLANSAPPLSVTDSAIAPSARMAVMGDQQSLYLEYYIYKCKFRLTHWNAGITHASLNTEQLGQQDSM